MLDNSFDVGPATLTCDGCGGRGIVCRLHKAGSCQSCKKSASWQDCKGCGGAGGVTAVHFQSPGSVAPRAACDLAFVAPRFLRMEAEGLTCPVCRRIADGIEAMALRTVAGCVASRGNKR